MQDVLGQSLTGKLWMEYLRHVHTLLSIRAERTGNWDLHLFAITEMIQVLHASAHLAYARSAPLYLDTMKNLPNVMGEAQFRSFTEDGYFTIRRTDKFWDGNFTDQTIEQVLMRMLKVPGGLAHGRGINDSTRTKWVHVIPRCIPICNSLEHFCGVHTQTSDQHKDLRASSAAQDAKDYGTFLNWLQLPSRLSCTENDGLVSKSSGVVADKATNADKAYDIGKAAAVAMTGHSYANVKLKRKDRVKSISVANDKVIVRGREVDVNSTLLFMRVTCIIKHQAEMEKYLRLEFGIKPLALFDDGIMCKTAKSVLADKLQVKCYPMLWRSGNSILHHWRWSSIACCQMAKRLYLCPTLRNIYIPCPQPLRDGLDCNIWWVHWPHVNQSRWAATSSHPAYSTWHSVRARDGSFQSSKSVLGQSSQG